MLNNFLFNRQNNANITSSQSFTTRRKNVAFPDSWCSFKIILYNGKKGDIFDSYRRKKKFQTRDNSFQRVCLTSSFPTGKTILLANNAIITSSQSFTTRRKCYVFRFIHSFQRKKSFQSQSQSHKEWNHSVDRRTRMD